MRPGIVIAYRDMGVVERRRSFARALVHYGQLGWPMVVEPCPAGQAFGRAEAINRGVERLGPTVTAVLQVDPDSFVSLGAAQEAVAQAGEDDGLVVGFDSHWYLTRAATGGALIDLDEGTFRPENWAAPEFADEHGMTGTGNAVAFSRWTWQQAGGYDERFGTWGGDDGAFAFTCAGLFAPTRRVVGPMVHLWHPRLPESEPGHPEYVRSWDLVVRYRDATPDQLRLLVAEHVGARRR